MKFKLENLFFTIAFILIITSTSAQKTDIKFDIHGLAHEEIIIAHHFGDNTLVDDTVNLNIQGVGSLTADTLFPKGLYICIFPNRSYFEFIMSDDQKFTLKTDTGKNAKAYIKKMEVKGSPVNEAFYDYQLFMIDKNERSMEVRKQLKNNPKKKQLKKELKSLNREVHKKWAQIQKEHPDSFLDKMLTAQGEVDVPEPPKDKEGNVKDTMFQYKYYRKHYLDNIDFSTNELLYSPVYHRKLKHYFDKVVIRRPDSVIQAAEELLQKLEDKPKYFQYTLSYIFNKYAKTKYMGFDQVVVYLADNYYLNGKAHWASEEYLDKLRKRVEKMKPNLLGAKAPRLKKAQSIEGYFYPLYDVEAHYTIIAFWEPHCGHCKKVIPKLYEEVFMGMNDIGVQVYAFYTQTNKKEWKSFLEEKGLTEWINIWDPNNFTDFRNKYDVYSTPTMYLLDKNKKIIAKRVDIKTIKQIIKEKEQEK